MLTCCQIAQLHGSTPTPGTQEVPAVRLMVSGMNNLILDFPPTFTLDLLYPLYNLPSLSQEGPGMKMISLVFIDSDRGDHVY